jgi:hypothetical protein
MQWLLCFETIAIASFFFQNLQVLRGSLDTAAHASDPKTNTIFTYTESYVFDKVYFFAMNKELSII